MNTYTPDVWQVIEIFSPKQGVIYKVLAGWYGGYLNGDSWQMNSGITHCEYDDDYWYFYGYSGSCYKCHKGAEKLSGMTGSVLLHLQKQLNDLNDGSYAKIIESYSGDWK